MVLRQAWTRTSSTNTSGFGRCATKQSERPSSSAVERVERGALGVERADALDDGRHRDALAAERADEGVIDVDEHDVDMGSPRRPGSVFERRDLSRSSHRSGACRASTSST
jgi:hypothetical protein